MELENFSYFKEVFTKNGPRDAYHTVIPFTLGFAMLRTGSGVLVFGSMLQLTYIIIILTTKHYHPRKI